MLQPVIYNFIITKMNLDYFAGRCRVELMIKKVLEAALFVKLF